MVTVWLSGCNLEGDMEILKLVASIVGPVLFSYSTVLLMPDDRGPLRSVIIGLCFVLGLFLTFELKQW